MGFERQIARWVASIEQTDLGYVYVRLFADAPLDVRHAMIDRFGKATVFLPPRQSKPLAA